MKIMIVDDSRAMRMLVVRALRRAGYNEVEVVEAGSGAEALAQIGSGGRPDLVLTDWNMPEMSGLDLVKKAKVDNPDLRFGFVTSESTDEMRSAAMLEGAAFFLCKPFTPEGLKAALQPVIGG